MSIAQQMLGALKRHWPLILILLIIFFVFGYVFQSIVNQCDGHFIYPLDDPYIHMSIAKNIVQSGIWGVTKYEFSSASSSLLYPLLIAGGYFIGNINAYLPLFINLIAALFLFVFFHFYLTKRKWHPMIIFLFLLSLLYLTPMVPIVFSGMEHTLHVVISLLFLILSVHIFHQKQGSKSLTYLQYWLAILVTMIRYEGLFLVCSVCVLFLFKKQFRKALFLGIIGWLPIIFFGCISLLNNNYFFPNSLILKRQIFETTGVFFLSWASALWASKHLLALCSVMGIGLAIDFINTRLKLTQIKSVGIVFFLTVLLHLQFAKTGWLFRYEAYLVVMGVYICFFSFNHLFKTRILIHKGQLLILVFTILVSFSQLFFWLQHANVKTIGMAYTIYVKRYLSAQFVSKYYEKKGILSTDIGALTYYNDIRLVDLFGLGSAQIVALSKQYRKKNQLIPLPELNQLLKENQVRIGLLSLRNYPWTCVAAWHTNFKYYMNSKVLYFYAIKPETKHSLVQNLKAFSSQLPKKTKLIIFKQDQ